MEARILLDGIVRAGAVLQARLTKTGVPAVATADGQDFLLPKGAPGVTEGSPFKLEVTREAIPGAEPWKRPLARVAQDGSTRDLRWTESRWPFRLRPTRSVPRVGRPDRRGAQRHRSLCRRRTARFAYSRDDVDRRGRHLDRERTGHGRRRRRRRERSSGMTSAAPSASICRPSPEKRSGRRSGRRSMPSCRSRSSGLRSTASDFCRSCGRAAGPPCSSSRADRASFEARASDAPRRAGDAWREASRGASGGDCRAGAAKRLD